ncbi:MULTISPECIES: FtsX-like permease family protein [Streptomyces]|uniref:FtsX-like permease family protein n=1 Tax=Streptomyces flaveolus TaxID=67297 RepID=A0ABV3ACR4_9ACTN|nr:MULTISPECIES: FtsX-like permease family protein [Streptomyces]KMS91824.1 peptide ABC transporter permease [Streptomyces regensis]KOG61964.1 peptide ABC transporter permease [Streptomyces antibioticus]
MRATLRWAHSDLRTHRGEALFLVLATAGVVASLLLATALFGYATNPWQRTFAEARGAHVWLHTAPSADARALARLDGVTAVAGPYRAESATVAARGTRASVELRATPDLPSVGRPLLTTGHWLDPAAPDGVVLESSLARALLAEPGDTLTLPGTARTLTVEGIADSAEAPYRPGEQPGLVWALPSAVRAPVGQVIGLRLGDPSDTDYAVQRAVTVLGAGAVGEVSTWQQARAEAQGDNRLLGQVLGLFGLGALVAAGFAVHGAIATRIRGHLRDLSVLKAIGFTPGQVVRIFLLQHLAYALLGAVAAAALTEGLGSRVPGRLGDAVGVWQGLPGHTLALCVVPAGAVLYIGLTTGLAAWRAGRVPPVPVPRRAAPTGGRLSGAARRALGLRLPAALVLGCHKAFAGRGRSLATVARLTLPLLLIVVALSAWTTIDRFHSSPERVGLPTALTVRSDGALDASGVRAVLAHDSRVAAAYPGVEVAALVPGQTGTIALRGVGTRAEPYPYALAEGRAARGPDEAVAGQGLLDLLDARVGDWVRMTVGDRPQILHIVGRTLEPRNAGRVVTTSLDTLRENDPELSPAFYELRLRPGADPHRVAAALASAGDGHLEVHPVTNPADGLSPLRGVVAGLIAVLALIGLVELLTAIGGSVREGERDVLALRAIGMSPRQITAITVTATSCTALAAVVAGTALGLPLARRLIDAQGGSSGIGAGIAQSPSPGLLLLLGAAAVLGAAALATLPASRAARRRLADTLSAVA